MGTIRITQLRSGVSKPPNQRATLRALGLRGIRSTVEHDDTPEILGMVRRVAHLVEVDEVKIKKKASE
jgi:large subunit ribosomal protein L30